MNQTTHHCVRASLRVAVACAGLLLALPAAPAEASAIQTLESLRQTAVNAYNARDWRAASEAADAYGATLAAEGLPRAGADFALVAFVGGHARFELWKTDPASFPYDFDKDVLAEMHESLRILQDDPFFKHNVMGTIYYERLKWDHFSDLALENAANWHMLRALSVKHESLAGKPKDGEEYTAFAKYVLAYINRAFEMARYSSVPEIYLLRVREACRFGFGSVFDERFVQLHEVVGFDDGNTKAGVLWQTALDLMNTEGSDAGEVIETFALAAGEAKGTEYRAEVYRQMADFSSRQDDHEYKLKAVEYGRMAFKLDPGNPEIQLQYGTSLHVISYAHYTAGRFEQALDAAREATSFEWEGDEVAYFDLSRAEANFGNKIDALVHAERAYQKARRKFQADELQPFRQNYVNILRQFGLTAKADQVELAAIAKQGS